MAELENLASTFNTVATKYDQFRPDYPDELYQTIFDDIEINSLSQVVEIGIGSGQATLPILKKGCSLIAVERGEELSKLCLEKFATYPNFKIITKKFEDIAFPRNQYDLVYAATSFHWIEESIGYSKVYAMLKSGGVFARFANHPRIDESQLELMAEIDQLYATYYVPAGKVYQPIKAYDEKQAIQKANIAKKYGFVDIKHALFDRKRTFLSSEYIALLETYSDHIAIEPNIRNLFFSKIKEAIDRHGGSLIIRDTIDLQLARKP